jgi:hypothetical protein
MHEIKGEAIKIIDYGDFFGHVFSFRFGAKFILTTQLADGAVKLTAPMRLFVQTFQRDHPKSHLPPTKSAKITTYALWTFS